MEKPVIVELKKIEKHFGPAPQIEVKNTEKAAYGKLELTEKDIKIKIKHEKRKEEGNGNEQ